MVLVEQFINISAFDRFRDSPVWWIQAKKRGMSFRIRSKWMGSIWKFKHVCLRRKHAPKNSSCDIIGNIWMQTCSLMEKIS